MNITTLNTAVQEAAPVEPLILSTAPSNVQPSKTNKIESTEKKQAAEQNSSGDNRTLSSKEAKELAQDMNELMDDLQTSLGFSIREELNHQVVVEITDRKTNELIKQIPSEELLTIKEKMEEFTGLIFDQSV